MSYRAPGESLLIGFLRYCHNIAGSTHSLITIFIFMKFLGNSVFYIPCGAAEHYEESVKQINKDVDLSQPEHGCECWRPQI